MIISHTKQTTTLAQTIKPEREGEAVEVIDLDAEEAMTESLPQQYTDSDSRGVQVGGTHGDQLVIKPSPSKYEIKNSPLKVASPLMQHNSPSKVEVKASPSKINKVIKCEVTTSYEPKTPYKQLYAGSQPHEISPQNSTSTRVSHATQQIDRSCNGSPVPVTVPAQSLQQTATSNADNFQQAMVLPPSTVPSQQQHLTRVAPLAEPAIPPRVIPIQPIGMSPDKTTSPSLTQQYRNNQEANAQAMAVPEIMPPLPLVEPGGMPAVNPAVNAAVNSVASSVNRRVESLSSKVAKYLSPTPPLLRSSPDSKRLMNEVPARKTQTNVVKNDMGERDAKQWKQSPVVHDQNLVTKTVDNWFICNFDGCKKQFKQVFTLYRHQREKHNAGHVRPQAARSYIQENSITVAALECGLNGNQALAGIVEEGSLSASGERLLRNLREGIKCREQEAANVDEMTAEFRRVNEIDVLQQKKHRQRIEADKKVVEEKRLKHEEYLRLHEEALQRQEREELRQDMERRRKQQLELMHREQQRKREEEKHRLLEEERVRKEQERKQVQLDVMEKLRRGKEKEMQMETEMKLQMEENRLLEETKRQQVEESDKMMIKMQEERKRSMEEERRLQVESDNEETTVAKAVRGLETFMGTGTDAVSIVDEDEGIMW